LGSLNNRLLFRLFVADCFVAETFGPSPPAACLDHGLGAQNNTSDEEPFIMVLTSIHLLKYYVTHGTNKIYCHSLLYRGVYDAASIGGMNMRKLVIALAAIAGLGFAAPAVARDAGDGARIHFAQADVKVTTTRHGRVAKKVVVRRDRHHHRRDWHGHRHGKTVVVIKKHRHRH
jgi:hypothetical protein